jgi:AcrR family transcriptional regulator
MALHRNTVLVAALAIADAEGIDAVTMRRVARELGVTPMAMYNHVRSRSDLLDGMADLVARAIERPSARWGWRRRATAVCLGIRAACLEHPAGIRLLLGTGALTPALLQPAEDALAALEEAGLRADAARTAWAALIGLTYGHVGYQLAGHMRGSRGAGGVPDPGAFPRLAALDSSPAFDWDRAFARALDALLDGIAPRRS